MWGLAVLLPFHASWMRLCIASWGCITIICYECRAVVCCFMHYITVLWYATVIAEIRAKRSQCTFR